VILMKDAAGRVIGFLNPTDPLNPMNPLELMDPSDLMDPQNLSLIVLPAAAVRPRRRHGPRGIRAPIQSRSRSAALTG
jgi:hypothetical protein